MRWLIAILLFGFAVLLAGLTDTSLWADEGWTIAATAEANPVEVVSDWVVSDVHPPLFFLGLNTWRRFTGDTLFELRYYSVLISLVGIAVTYQLGRALLNAQAGRLAALFYALHDLVKVLTQEVRHYPQQMMLVSLALWLYWRFWRRPTRGRGIAFVVAGTALIYTHYWGGFVLLGAALHALITRRRQFRAYAYAFAGIALLYLPWLPVLYYQITLERPGGLPHALENSQTVYAVLLYQLVGIPELFWLMLAVVGAIGVFGQEKRPLNLTLRPSLHDVERGWGEVSGSLLLLIVAVLTPALSILINTVYPTLSFRSLAVVVPMVMTLAAYGLSRFRSREQTALVIFIVLHSLFSTSARPLQRPPWPEIADQLAHQTTDSDVVLLENDTDEYALAYYLDEINHAHSEHMRVFHPDVYPDYIETALDGRDGVWIVKLGWPAISDPRPELANRGFAESAPEIDYDIYIDRPILVWRMDRPGDVQSVFADEIGLIRADVRAQPAGVAVNLVWTATTPPTRDYTVSAFLLGESGSVANQDGFPPTLTSTWEPGNVYFDTHFIPTAGVPPGDYQVGVQVYYFTDSAFTTFENVNCSDSPDCRFIILADVRVN